MRLIKAALAAGAVAGGVAAGAMSLAAATASGEPTLPPPLPAEQGPYQPAAAAPAWAPPQPTQPVWAHGNPVVWDDHYKSWGLWINGFFLPL